MIKGFRPIKGWIPSLLILCIIVQIVSLFGFLDGFNKTEGKLDLVVFDWGPITLIYTAIFWGSWAVTLFFLYRSAESLQVKVGASFLLSTPAFLALLYLWVAA